jgi:Ca2+-binding EF-hand superfamily protein
MTSAPNSRLVFVAMLFMMCCFSGAIAQTTPPSTDRTKKIEKFNEKFDAADINHDGFLTRDEAAKSLPHIAKHFDAIDIDHDGKLSRQEIAQFLAAKRKAKEE